MIKYSRRTHLQQYVRGIIIAFLLLACLVLVDFKQ